VFLYLQSQNKHGDKYDYSLTKYINSETKVKIICKEHGVFEQVARGHYKGSGCPKCTGQNKTTKDIINEFKSIHGTKFGYSLVEYKNSYTKVKIICNIHGVFEQSPNSHIQGQGCRKCVIDDLTYTTEKFIELSKNKHGDKYDYSLVDYKNNITKVKIICTKHGVFEQTPNNHLKGSGCPKCNSSKGELIIDKYLVENNIIFEPQKTFDNCRNTNPLHFDFYIPNLNLCIEYDGIQHFKPIEFFDGEEGFRKTQINDQIKTQYCKDNNIELLRIKYDENTLKKLKNLT